MKFEIKNPCTEDYSKMTPVEGGVFCKQCEKKVFDLTVKKNSEIKEFFESENGTQKCIRISKTQLFELNFDGFFSRFRFWNIWRRCALVIYFVFGMGLFSCQEEPANSDAQKNTFKTAAVSLKKNEQASRNNERISVGFADYTQYIDPVERTTPPEKSIIKAEIKSAYDFVHGFDPDYRYEAGDEEEITAEKFKKEESEKANRRDANGKIIPAGNDEFIDEDFRPFRGSVFVTVRDSASH